MSSAHIRDGVTFLIGWVVNVKALFLYVNFFFIGPELNQEIVVIV